MAVPHAELHSSPGVLDRERHPDIRRVKAGRDAAGLSWLGLRANRQHQVTGVAQFPLLPAVLVLLLFVGISMWAWRREGD